MNALCTVHVNANVRPGGMLRVQVRDALDGQVLRGLEFAAGIPVTKDGVRQAVRWRGGAFTTAAGRSVQFEFELREADLFAFETSPATSCAE